MEQALVFASIVLGIAVAFELQHLHQLLRAPNIRWHWAQPLFAFFVLLSIMSIWWMIAGREIEGEMTLARFMPIMWGLVMLNLLAAVALPDKIPEEGIDLAEYYQANQRYMWGLYILFFLPLGVNWFVYSMRRAENISQFVQLISGDMLGLCAFVFLFFARKWWLVAVGFAGLATLSLSWLTRAL
ncbi:hypothetical protein [Aurantiacibacter sp. D1-12]|uniref:hypothetical protein n=1 Tax=Aurantiacibacter sp. D1-12 TaxID=2993658 RepID=UPI00237C5C7D|nr:hypothetical protein [Aurantiacibacter sp. D1-12]MDE1466350.1 hypothetical protein [Aurantiacibacter sp. D1-12]